MDTASYTYSALEKKYQKFVGPAFEITIGGKTIAVGKGLIPELEVELAADGAAGGCTFSIDGQYDPKGSKWQDDLDKLIQVGTKLSIKGGYVQKKEIFYGYIDDYSLEFTSESTPKVRVNGVDGLAYLMSMREPMYGGKEKAAALVKKILQKSVSAGFAKSVKVGSLADFETPVLKEQVNDWKFLNLMAQRYGMTLLAVDGELIFDNLLSKSSPILTLAQNGGLHSFSKRVSLAGQVGKVEVWGRDVNQKPIKGEASSVTAGGSGKSAAQLVSALSQAAVREYSEYASTEAECKQLAQNRLNSIAMGLVSGEGSCVGIPELIPGRYLKIDSKDKTMAGSYFLSKVRHQFSMDGYITSFEFKGAKV